MSSKARWILFPSIKFDFVWCADVTRGLLSGFEAMGCNCVTSGKICLFAFQFAAADRSMVHSLAAGLPWRQQTPNRFPDPLKWRFLDENYSFRVKSSEKIHVFMYITANMCQKAQIVNMFRVRSKMANFAGASTLKLKLTRSCCGCLRSWCFLDLNCSSCCFCTLFFSSIFVIPFGVIACRNLTVLAWAKAMKHHQWTKRHYELIAWHRCTYSDTMLYIYIELICSMSLFSLGRIVGRRKTGAGGQTSFWSLP